MLDSPSPPAAAVQRVIQRWNALLNHQRELHFRQRRHAAIGQMRGGHDRADLVFAADFGGFTEFSLTFCR
jgi:hypothetical protein